MKMDFTRPILDRDGKPVSKSGAEDSQFITLGHLAVGALDMAYQDDTGEKRNARGLLAGRIYASDGPIDVTLEEMASIKDVIGKTYGPFLVSSAWALLEG